MRKILSFILSSILLFSFACSKKKMTIMTAGKTGNYYKAATELKEVLKDSGIDLEIIESPGSFKNIAQLGSGKANLAIAQFDVIMVYVALGKEFQELANASQVVAPLNAEAVHIIVNKASGIKNLAALAGKKLAVGPKHSGSWISAWALMRMLNNVNIEKAQNIFKEPYTVSMEKLLKGQVDAMFVTAMTGMPFLKKLPASYGEKIQLLSLGSGFIIPANLKLYYSPEKIPALTYAWQKDEAITLATPSYLLAYKNYDSSAVKVLAQAIYKNAANLKTKSKTWNLISEDQAKAEIQNKIPYHEGVRSYLGVK